MLLHRTMWTANTILCDMTTTSSVNSPYESDVMTNPPTRSTGSPLPCRPFAHLPSTVPFRRPTAMIAVCRRHTSLDRELYTIPSTPSSLHLYISVSLSSSSTRRRRRWQTEQPPSSASAARSRRFSSFPPWDLYRERLSIFQRVIFGRCSRFRRFRGGGRCGAFRHGLQRDLTLVSRPSLAIYLHCTAPLRLTRRETNKR